jgi:hypothetical protein
MGQEIPCTVRHEGKSATGKALLESSALIFRGDFRLKIPFASITSLRAVAGELRIRTKEGVSTFVLGSKAETWRERIANPKSLVEKLGPRAGDGAAVMGKFTADFLRDLKTAGAKISEGKVSAATQWIFLAVDSQADLAKIKSFAKAMEGAMALWIVYPKGRKTLTESDVRSAGLKAGLLDIKVASFSPEQTALKFVIPKAKR